MQAELEAGHRRAAAREHRRGYMPEVQDLGGAAATRRARPRQDLLGWPARSSRMCSARATPTWRQLWPCSSARARAARAASVQSNPAPLAPKPGRGPGSTRRAPPPDPPSGLAGRRCHLGRPEQLLAQLPVHRRAAHHLMRAAMRRPTTRPRPLWATVRRCWRRPARAAGRGAGAGRRALHHPVCAGARAACRWHRGTGGRRNRALRGLPDHPRRQGAGGAAGTAAGHRTARTQTAETHWARLAALARRSSSDPQRFLGFFRRRVRVARLRAAGPGRGACGAQPRRNQHPLRGHDYGPSTPW